MTGIRKERYMVGLLLLLTLLLFACATEDTESEAETDTADDDAQGEEDTETNPEEEEDEGEAGEAGGEMNVAFYQQPPSMDPHVSTSAATGMITRHVFESLMALNENYEAVPMLAESVDESEDGLTYTFHLREGVQFHNGEEMTSEDVIASMDRWMEHNSSTELLYEGATWEEDGDYTVTLNLESTSSGAIDALAPILQSPAIMPKEVIDSADASGVDEFIGTGPFEFVEWAQDQHIHLAKFDDYEPIDMEPNGMAGHKEALVDDIYFEIVLDASTRLAGITTGQYDVAYSLPNDNYEQLNEDPNIVTHEAPSGHSYLIFNERDELFSDPVMRQAVNAALNIDEILLAGYSNEALYELDHGFMSQHSANWYTEAGIDNYNQQNTEEAQRLLEEAGYDGQEITVLTSRDVPTIYNMAVVIQEQLSELGLNINMESYDWATVSDLREDEEYWGFYVNNVPDVNVPAQILPLSTTWAGWAEDPTLVSLHEEIVEAPSHEEAYEKWEELQAYAWEENLPVVKMGNHYAFDVSTDEVEGLVPFHNPILWNTRIVE